MSEPAIEPVVAPAPAPAPAAEPAPAPVSVIPAADAPPTAAEPPVAVQANWPDDWRDKLAGEDKAYRTALERFADPAALAKSYRELQVRMSKGELKPTTPAPENASDEERAAWRKEHGLPEKPENYDVKLPNGMVLGAAEQPVVNEFKALAYKSNMTPAQFNDSVGWFMEYQQQQEVQQREQDIQRRVQAEEGLRADWGSNYLPEVKAVSNFLAAAPQELGTDLLAARMPDGSLVGSDPRFVRWMADLRREINPMASLVPAGTADPVKAGAARLAELQGKLGTPEGQQEYWRGPNASALQQEMRDLLSAQEKMAGRAA